MFWNKRKKRTELEKEIRRVLLLDEKEKAAATAAEKKQTEGALLRYQKYRAGLAPFSTCQKCPRCNALSYDIRHSSVDNDGMDFWAFWEAGKWHDHLVFRCYRCEFKWWSKCADAEDADV